MSHLSEKIKEHALYLSLLDQYSHELKHSPEDVVSRLKLAEVLRLLERYDEAVSLYSSVAWSYAISGNLVQSILICKLILELRPHHQQTQQMLARLYASKEMRDKKQSVHVRKIDGKWIADPCSKTKTRPPSSFKLPLADSRDEEIKKSPKEHSSNSLIEAELPLHEEDYPVEKTPKELIDTLNLKRKPKETGLEKIPTSDDLDDLIENTDIDLSNANDNVSVDTPRRGQTLKEHFEAQSLKKETIYDKSRQTLSYSEATKYFGSSGGRIHKETLPMPSVSLTSLIEEDVENVRKVTQSLDSARKIAQNVDVEIEANISSAIKQAEQKTNDKVKSDIIRNLPQFPLFSSVPEPAFIALIEKLEARFFDAEESVICEGERGSSIFFISYGYLDVRKKRIDQSGDDFRLNLLKPGDYFGEFAMLNDQRRHASVVALEPTELLELSDTVLKELTNKYPVIGEKIIQLYEKRVMDMVLATCPIFQAIAQEHHQDIANRFRKTHYSVGETILEQDNESDAFYILLLGKVCIEKSMESGEVVELATLCEGDYFGEMGLIRGAPVEATVKALSEVDVLYVDANELYEIAAIHPDVWKEIERRASDRHAQNKKILERILV